MSLPTRTKALTIPGNNVIPGYGATVTNESASTILVNRQDVVPGGTLEIPAHVLSVVAEGERGSAASVTYNVAPSDDWSQYPAGYRDATTLVSTSQPYDNAGGVFNAIPNPGDAGLYDPGGCYDVETGLYTVPISGLYQIDAKLRVQDGTSATSYAQGVHTSGADGPWMPWYRTVGAAGDPATLRNGAAYWRMGLFRAGDRLRHVAYSDVGVRVGDRSLGIVFLST